MKIVYTSVRPCMIVVLIDNVAARKHKISWSRVKKNFKVRSLKNQGWQPSNPTEMKKSAQRDANSARELAVVRFGHRPPARPLQTRPQTGSITIHCAAKLSAQCNYYYRATLCVSAVFAVGRCLSVCLLRWWIVSRRLKISSNFILDLEAPSF